MPPPSRRNVLTAAGAGASALFSPALARALAAPARRIHGTLQDVEHVVILMQENRSFDHYFGCLRGVRGYGDPRPLTLPSGRSVFHQPLAPGVDDVVLPFRLNSQTTNAECMPSLDHSWKGQHSLWRNHDAWAPVKGPLTMGYFDREDIPFYYALADAFTVCDAYHCSIFGPTNPNRLFLFSGTSGLTVKRPGLQVVTNADDGNWTADAASDDKGFAAYAWTTYAERLQAAGVSWKLYQEYDNFGDNSLAFFAAFRSLQPSHPLHQRGRTWVDGSTPENAKTSRGEHLIAAFAKDVQADRLPSVSWLVAPTHASEHPDASPGYGEAFTAGIFEALAANPEVFAKTVFILNYDENDGFFDHVPPPVPAVVDAMGASTVAMRDEVFVGQPVGLGPRVPMIVASPWTRGGWVNSQLFDHTSVLRFLEARFGVAEPNISAWRRAVAGDLTSVFDFASAQFASAQFASAQATSPRLPRTEGVVERVDAACKLDPPLPDFTQTALPRQEAGQRPARPLPYSLLVAAQVNADPARPLTLTFDNRGTAGAHFSAHAHGALSGPWSYTVEAGKVLTHTPQMYAAPGQPYDLSVFGPNGFFRRFRGRPSRGAEVSARYEPLRDRIVLILTNTGAAPRTLSIRPAAGSARSVTLTAGQVVEDVRPIGDRDHWYDLTVTDAADPSFLRHLAGHMETGAPSASDPGIAVYV
jgi:phospholipase C